MTARTNPNHWIWQQEYPHRFEPDEGPYLAMRVLCRELGRDELVSHMEDLIAEGMSAERIVALCGFDQKMPPEIVQVFGCGIAYWITRMNEGDQP